MNLTIGGTLGGPIDNSIFDNMVAMEVDYVRIYQKISESNIFGKSTISENEGQLEYSSFVPASKYTWTVPSTAQIVSGAGTSSILVDWGCEEGNVELELETICDTAVISLPVTFEEIQLMGKSLVYQKEKSLKYSAPTISGATYAWTVPEGVNFIGDNDTNEIELEWGCNPGQISLEITGTCLSKTITKDVAIVPLLITGPEYLSSWSSNIDYLLDNNQVGSIKWGVPDDVIINSGETSYLLNVDWGTAAGYVTVELTNSCGVLKDSILVNITDNLILADFDVIDPEFLVFGGAHMEKAENPSKSELNSSDLTGMAYKDATATTWGGIYFDLDQTLDFIYGSTFSLSVFAPVTGNVLFKIENNSGPEEVEISKPITKVNEWEKLSWTFNNVASDTYNRIALFFDFGQTRQDSFYFDDVVLNRNLTPGISLSQKEDIMERDEDGKIIEVILSGDRFVEVLNMDNWIFENLPEGVSVGSANRISDTRVDLVLSGNATEDYDLDITNFSVLILAAELVGSNTNLSISTGVVFTALIEDFIQENNTLDKFITVYPNPVNKLLNIKVNNEFTGELSGKIINSEGKVLNEFRITNEKLIQIDMKEFPKGTYIVSLKGPKGNWNRIIFYQ